MEDLSIRDPKSNLVYNNFTHEYFMKVFRNDFEKAKEYREETISKYINFNNVKYAVFKDDIMCIHSDAFIRNSYVKYFNTFEEAEKQYWDNCFDMGINGVTTARKLAMLEGEDFLAGNADIRIFQKG